MRSASQGTNRLTARRGTEGEVNGRNEGDTMYKIVRQFLNGGKRTIATNLTLEEAQAHCKDPETSSAKAISAKAKRYTAQHGPWFDGYTET